MTNNPLKIVQLQAKNFMKLKAVEITPQGDTVIISGKNAAGKSAVLNAIVFALGGKKALNKIPDPVRHGEESTKVTIDLGDYSVTRKWKDGKSQLEITSNDNRKVRYGSPAGMLDSIVGELSFDPLEFANQSEKDQIKTLLELVKLPIDLYALDDDRKLLYESRTLVNRAVKHLEGKVAGFPVVDAPDTEINTSDIMSAMELATKTISDNKDIRDTYSRKLNTQIEWTARIHALEYELLEKQDKLLNLECELDILKPQVETLIDPDLETFKDQLQNAEQVNTNVRSMKQRTQIQDELNAEITNSDNLTTQITEIDELKERTLQEANMPIDGLSFDSEGVNYNGSIFEQCSSAEKLKVSLSIAMAMNPKLRVIRIMDGSLLDSSNMAIIEEMAKDNDFQVWVECVDESGKLGVYIEDGSVVAVNE
jgi:chromosome segregation ATPase